MHRSDGVDNDRVLVWCCVVFAHLLALWLLTRPHGNDSGAEAGALDVVWIEAALPAAAMPSRPETPPRPIPPGSTIVRDDAPLHDAASPSVTPAPHARDSQSLSAVFLEQGRAWVKEQHPPGDFTRNPLTGRSVPRTDERRDRFAMREPIAPAAIVAGIGALFGGGGNIVDCARVRGNIADLATGGASERLEEELRRDRRLCRDAAMP